MTTETKITSAGSITPPGRLASLDALRGLDMFFFIGIGGMFRALPQLSDNPLFRFLADQCDHPQWLGFTAWDMIFPLFIFTVGVAMPFSFAKRVERDRKAEIYKHVLIRAGILVVLGFVHRGLIVHPNWGYYSVLYRIAFSYLFGALILLNFRPRGQAYWAFGLLLGYWLVMWFIPVPDFGARDFSEEGNLSTFLSNWIAQAISPTVKHTFSITLIPAVSTALFGALAGQWLRSDKSSGKKTLGLLVAGGLFVAFGLLMHQWFPLSKKMASTSFSFLSCGLSVLLLCLFYWIIDVRGYRKWAFFFIVVGMNSITIYLVNHYFNFHELAGVFLDPFSGYLSTAKPLTMATASAGLKWLFLYWLYRHKLFLKV